MNKLLILLFLILFVDLNKSQEITDPIERAQAQYLLGQLGYSDTNLCNTQYAGRKIITCGEYNGNTVVVDITIENNITPNGISYYDLSNVAFQDFTLLTGLKLGNRAYVLPNILSQIQVLSTLETLSIDYIVDSYDVNLPSTLKSLSFRNFNGTFYTKWVNTNFETLKLENVINFQISGTFPTSTKLTYLSIPVPSNGLPDLSQSFPNLQTYKIYVQDVNYNGNEPAIPASYLGSFNFPNLEWLVLDLQANFTGPLNKLFYSPDFSKLTSLNTFDLESDSIIPNGNQIIDFTHTKQFQFIMNNNQDFFKKCNNCLRFPTDTILKLVSVELIIDSLDVSNCSGITLDTITPLQEVTFKHFNFYKMKSLIISECEAFGDLPDGLCKITDLSIQFNLFNGTVPSCYMCYSYYRGNILPNEFKDFDESSPELCPNFKINPLSSTYILSDTYGQEVYISGVDLGFQLNAYDENDAEYDYEWIIGNELLVVYIPLGAGTQHHTVTVEFTDGFIKFTFTYIPPTITSYYIDPVHQTINFIGSGFSYQGNKNTINLSTYDYQFNVWANHENDFAYLAVNQSFITDNLNEGDEFTISVDVSDQSSSSVTFIYSTKSISITDDILLNTTGSSITVSGSFIVSDINSVNLVIGGIECIVNKVTPTSLSFTYPKSTANIGETDLYLTINGLFYSKKVQIQIIEESSSSSSSSDSQSSSSSNSDSSSSDDHISSSFKLNISIGLSLLLILLISI